MPIAMAHHQQTEQYRPRVHIGTKQPFTTTANAAQGLQQVPPAMQNQQWIGCKESLSNATDELNR